MDGLHENKNFIAAILYENKNFAEVILHENKNFAHMDFGQETGIC